MKKSIIILLAVMLPCVARAQGNIEKWEIFELSLQGPAKGNPFVGTELYAEFTNGDRTYRPEGFYDGGGVYKIRFMPDEEGAWTYETFSNKEELDGKKGEFTCVKPSGDNHGPVCVRNQYHFAYADGEPFYPFGTTIYEWPYQDDATRNATIESLKSSPFNKARFLAMPPYNNKYVEGPLKLEVFPFEGTSKDDWDFSRFNPEFFRDLEKCIEQLRDIAVQADLILFRPYDDGKWGFDQMDQETNRRFVRYTMARFAAYRNIWWSLANENSFMESVTDEEWDELFRLVQEKDPYQHQRSIHNAGRIYNYTEPWVTHVSLQYYNAVRVPAVTPLLRDLIKKPVVHDEINYEGDIERRWGQLSGEEMTYRFWNAIIGGGYATHGESYQRSTWISTGGKLTGDSPARIAFLKNIVEHGPEEGMEPIDQYYELNMAGKAGEYYLIYFGKDEPMEWEFLLPRNEMKDGLRYKAEIIDTWNMTITPVKQVFETKRRDNYRFIDKNNRKIKMPGKPYMALRIERVE